MIFSISISPSYAVTDDNSPDTKLDSTQLQMNDAKQLGEIPNNSNPLSSADKFHACTSLHIQTARLACFDEVANTGNESEYTRDKKQLDLGGILKSTLSGKPKIVIFSPDTVNASLSKTHLPDMTKIVDNSKQKQGADKLINNEILFGNYQIDGEVYNQNNSFGKETVSEGGKIKTGVDIKYNNNVNVQTLSTTDKQLPTNTTDISSQQSTKFDRQKLSIEVADIKATAQNSVEDENGSSNTDISSLISPLSLMYDLDKNDEVGTWKPRPHNPIYIIPLFMHENPNRSPSTPSQDEIKYTQNDYRTSELKFQTSFKSKMAQDLFDTDADLWMGYTQQSHWQVYNEDNSRPFRAHDYMPEFFLTQPVYTELPMNGKLRMLGAGFMHHSNGEDYPKSRTWNRIYLMGGAEWENKWGKITVMPRLWKRLSSKSKTKKAENPDIEDFYGYGDIKVYYDMDSGQSLSGTFRLNPMTGKGATEFDYIHPMDNNVNLFLNVSHGYGESLIEYNHKDTTFGVGIMLNDWRGL